MVAGRVSTIIPVHNRAAMLRTAVASVLGQDYPDVELIIVDDGSTDDTPQVIRELESDSRERIRSVRIDNSGPGPAREAGRLLATGEFLQYLDSDDRLLPEKFALQVAALERRPDCEIAYGYTRLVDQEGRELCAPFKWTARDFDRIFPALLVDRWWCTHTPLYRRRLTDAIGPWSALRWSQDWEYDARAGALGARLVNCHAYVSEHCHHEGARQTSSANWERDETRLKNRVELLAALLRNAQAAGVDQAAPERQHLARWAFRIARNCAAANLGAETMACLAIADAAAGPKGRGRRGIDAFGFFARTFGVAAAGRIASWLERGRPGRGEATLPLSYKTDDLQRDAS
jgi:glycosyltransferase involved in cell wall biosynthesis